MVCKRSGCNQVISSARTTGLWTSGVQKVPQDPRLPKSQWRTLSYPPMLRQSVWEEAAHHVTIHDNYQGSPKFVGSTTSLCSTTSTKCCDMIKRMDYNHYNSITLFYRQIRWTQGSPRLQRSRRGRENLQAGMQIIITLSAAISGLNDEMYFLKQKATWGHLVHLLVEIESLLKHSCPRASSLSALRSIAWDPTAGQTDDCWHLHGSWQSFTGEHRISTPSQRKPWALPPQARSARLDTSLLLGWPNTAHSNWLTSQKSLNYIEQPIQSVFSYLKDLPIFAHSALIFIN